MKRIVDIYRKNQRDQVLWTYVLTLGEDGSHPSIQDFKNKALALAVIEGRGTLNKLEAFVHPDPVN